MSDIDRSQCLYPSNETNDKQKTSPPCNTWRGLHHFTGKAGLPFTPVRFRPVGFPRFLQIVLSMLSEANLYCTIGNESVDTTRVLTACRQQWQTLYWNQHHSPACPCYSDYKQSRNNETRNAFHRTRRNNLADYYPCKCAFCQTTGMDKRHWQVDHHRKVHWQKFLETIIVLEVPSSISRICDPAIIY